MSLVTFLRVYSNLQEVSFLSWQNTYPNLKTTFHIKLKFFLWNKLLENLLLAKYLISVAAPLKVINERKKLLLLQNCGIKKTLKKLFKTKKYRVHLGRSFIMHVHLFEKLAFLTHWYVHIRVRKKYVTFSENFPYD